eukprot:6489934-Amphidinium_carterae.1
MNVRTLKVPREEKVVLGCFGPFAFLLYHHCKVTHVQVLDVLTRKGNASFSMTASSMKWFTMAKVAFHINAGHHYTRKVSKLSTVQTTTRIAKNGKAASSSSSSPCDIYVLLENIQLRELRSLTLWSSIGNVRGRRLRRLGRLLLSDCVLHKLLRWVQLTDPQAVRGRKPPATGTEDGLTSVRQPPLLSPITSSSRTSQNYQTQVWGRCVAHRLFTQNQPSSTQAHCRTFTHAWRALPPPRNQNQPPPSRKYTVVSARTITDTVCSGCTGHGSMNMIGTLRGAFELAAILAYY